MIHIDIEHKILTTSGERILKIKVDIPEKQLVCVSGKSGVGKTTLFRMLAGLTSPDKGVIQIGKTIVFNSFEKLTIPPQKRNIGFMFQDYALFPNMTVEENISFAQSKVKDPSWITKLLKTFDLEVLRKQKPDRLSGGQKQRVALARALARKTDILLLDEPLSALDREMRVELQEEILKVHKLFNSTILLVSHDEDEINKMASCILHMSENGVDLVREKESC